MRAKKSYSIQCLGVGRGATNFATGEPSTAHVLKQDGKPILMLDMGAGVGRSAASILGSNIPNSIFISHNHSDHTGDLPVFLASRQGQRTTLMGHKNVLSTVRQHRLHELPSVGVNLEKDLTWREGEVGHTMQFEGLDFVLFRTAHEYECYGFTMYDGDKPLLGWTADSRFDNDVYASISEAPIAVVHGRDRPSGDHAAFDEIEDFASANPATQFYVAHYGATETRFQAPNVSLLSTGQDISLLN